MVVKNLRGIRETRAFAWLACAVLALSLLGCGGDSTSGSPGSDVHTDGARDIASEPSDGDAADSSDTMDLAGNDTADLSASDAEPDLVDEVIRDVASETDFADDGTDVAAGGDLEVVEADAGADVGPPYDERCTGTVRNENWTPGDPYNALFGYTPFDIEAAVFEFRAVSFPVELRSVQVLFGVNEPADVPRPVEIRVWTDEGTPEPGELLGALPVTLRNRDTIQTVDISPLSITVSEGRIRVGIVMDGPTYGGLARISAATDPEATAARNWFFSPEDGWVRSVDRTRFNADLVVRLSVEERCSDGHDAPDEAIAIDPLPFHYEGTLAQPWDRDWFVIDPPPGLHAQISLRGGETADGLRAVVCDASMADAGGCVADGLAGEDHLGVIVAGTPVVQAFPAAGPYYLVVEHADRALGAYELDVSDDCADEHHLIFNADDVADRVGWRLGTSAIEGTTVLSWPLGEPVDGDTMTWRLGIPCTGTWHVWGRALDDGGADSYRVRVDGADDEWSYDLDCSSDNAARYVWRELNRREPEASACAFTDDPWIQEWRAGEHEVVLGFDGSYAFSRFYVTNAEGLPGDSETDCFDGVDDDRDGHVDCLDTQCAEGAACQPYGPCVGGCPAGSECLQTGTTPQYGACLPTCEATTCPSGPGGAPATCVSLGAAKYCMVRCSLSDSTSCVDPATCVDELGGGEGVCLHEE